MQMQIYAGLPLILTLLRPRKQGFRQRVAITCVLVIALSLAYQAWIVWEHRISLPLPQFAMWDQGPSTGHTSEAKRMAWAFYKHLYTSLLARIADASGGVLLYILATSNDVRRCLHAHACACTVGSAIAFVGSIVQIFSGIATLQPEADPHLPLFLRLGGLVGLMSAWALAASGWLLLYTIVQPDRASRKVARWLSSRALGIVAEHSYSISLLHWPLLIMLFRCLPVAASIGPLSSLRTFTAVYFVLLILCIAAASLQDHLVGAAVSLGQSWLAYSGRAQATTALVHGHRMPKQVVESQFSGSWAMRMRGSLIAFATRLA